MPSDARTIDALLRRARRAQTDAEVDRRWDELEAVRFEHLEADLDAALVAAPLQA